MKNSQSYFLGNENNSYLGTEGVFIYIRVTHVKKMRWVDDESFMNSKVFGRHLK